MARKAQARRQGGNRGTPAWAWLLVGLFAGALGYFGYQQYRELTAPAPTEVPVPDTGAKPAKADAEPAVEPPASGVDDGVLDTDYSFYDVLPADEAGAVADAPAEEKPGEAAGAKAETKPEAKPKSTAEAANAPADTARYLLQAGAFERAADAEDLKARIALAGEAARVETAEVNGKTLHRVRLGPYAGEKAAAAAKRALADQGIASVSVKLP